jgi:hypothetical protein
MGMETERRGKARESFCRVRGDGGPGGSLGVL